MYFKNKMKTQYYVSSPQTPVLNLCWNREKDIECLYRLYSIATVFHSINLPTLSLNWFFFTKSGVSGGATAILLPACLMHNFISSWIGNTRMFFFSRVWPFREIFHLRVFLASFWLLGSSKVKLFHRRRWAYSKGQRRCRGSHQGAIPQHWWYWQVLWTASSQQTRWDEEPGMQFIQEVQ